MMFGLSKETEIDPALDWRQREDVRLAQAQSREASHRFELATKTRVEVWDWKTSNEPRLRLAHHTEWPGVDLEYKSAELALHESQQTLMAIEAAAKDSVRNAWESLFRKAFASLEQIARGDLSDRLSVLGELWDQANALGIPLPVALTSVTMSPTGLREWCENVRKATGE